MKPLRGEKHFSRFDLNEIGTRDSAGTQIDFPDVRIEMAEINN